MEKDTETTIGPGAAQTMSDGEEPVAHPMEISVARLNLICLGLWICMFLSAIETTIVATSLIEITNYFNEYNRASWIVAAYLLTYNGFLLISSKMCDIIGHKAMLLTACVIFMVFSILCGVAQTLDQLIVFRAFQGIGGSGIYGVVFITLMKIVSIKRMPPYAAGISSVFAVASICGPLLGGTISQHSTWRWIFYLNGPGIAVSMVILFFALPKSTEKLEFKKAMRRMDWVGGVLSIGWSILIIFALQEGGVEFGWRSATIVSTLVIGAIMFVVFVVFEVSLDRHTTREPIFPIELIRNPVVSLLLLMTFTMGFSFYMAVIGLPQRFQVVNGSSPTHAGILMLPLLLSSPVAAALLGGFVTKKLDWGIWVIPLGAVLTLVGTVLLGELPSDQAVQHRQYGFLVILGLGMGSLMPTAMMMIKLEVEEKHNSTAIGAINMLRVLGGLIGVSICTALLHSELKKKLPSILTEDQISSLLKSTHILTQLDAATRDKVRIVYSDAYNLQFRVISAFAAVTVIAAVSLVMVIRGRGSIKEYVMKGLEGKQ